jgi:hypothetical protein
MCHEKGKARNHMQKHEKLIHFLSESLMIWIF